MSFKDHMLKASGKVSTKKSQVEKKPFNELVSKGHAEDVSEEEFFLTHTWQHESDSQASMLDYLDAKEKKKHARKEKRKRETNGYSDWDDETYDEAGDSEDIVFDTVEVEGKVVADQVTSTDQLSRPAITNMGVVSAAPPVVQPNPKQLPIVPSTIGEASSVDLAEFFINEDNFINLNGVVYRYDKCVYNKMTMSELKYLCYKRFYEEIRARGNPNFAKEIAEALQSRILGTEAKKKPNQQDYAVLKNVRLNLKAFAYEPNGPDCIETAYINIEYDANATECPYFDQYLHTVSQGNECMEELIMEVMAYSIIPNCPVKKFFLVYGERDCGKSVMINLTSSFLTDEAVSCITLHELSQRFNSGCLMDARLNVDADLPDKVIPDDDISQLKKLTSALDKNKGENKYEKSRAFNPNCKLLFASNHILKMRKLDEAFLGRLIVIPFCYSIPKEEQDEDLIQHLYDERQAIFNKIIKRYRRLAENHFKFSICAEPEKYCKATTINTDKTSLFAFSKFISDTIVVTGDEKDFVATQELAGLFDIFSEKNVCAELRRNFPALLSSYIKENYADSVRSVRRGANNARGYCGVRLANSDR